MGLDAKRRGRRDRCGVNVRGSAMKSVFLGVAFFAVIQLCAVVLAADGVDAVDSRGSLTCDLEDAVLGCQGFPADRNAVEVCCHVIVAADERGCFCKDSSLVNYAWAVFGGDFCELRISLLGSERCLNSEFSESRLSAPGRRLSTLRSVRKLGMEERSSESHSDLEKGNVSDDEYYTDDEKGDAPEEQDTGVKDVEKNETEDGRFPKILAAGFMSSFLLSCYVICPCWAPRRKPDKVGSMKQDISINSISSHDTSRTMGRTSSLAYSATGAHLPVDPGGSALTFTMAELQKVTGGFSPSHKIGQGGFGTVYKGRLRDGSVVAVKRAKKDAFEARLSVEFQNELEMLSQVDHLNLVKLIGYLEEEHERIIVVEYVPNGNLREHLDGIYGTVLDMATRLDVSIDIAHALTYLHLYAERPIIHRDVKASNILLTDTCRAKVADFGFSRAGPTDQGATHVSTQVKGTAGYLDPEYLTTYQLNQKSDVYSFGILLIEIFTGRRPIELKRPSDERVTVRWAFKKFVEGKVMDILDPRLEKTPAIQMVMERLAELAFACSAPTKNDRPSMKKAQEALWQIRKDYQGQTTAGSPPPSSRMSRGTFRIVDADSRASSSMQSPRMPLSPRMASPTRSSTPVSPAVLSGR